MAELHKFLFEGLPVRGMLVRITDAWQTILARRAQNVETGPYPPAVVGILGEMTAAATLLQSNIKFEGSLVLQLHGDGPLKLAVVEVQPDLRLRATAKVVGEPPSQSGLSAWANVGGQGRCAITLDPARRLPGQQPYQGMVPLYGDQGEPIERVQDVLAHYMLQSEQLDTCLVLAANDQVAAGLLIQRLPLQGEVNLAGRNLARDEDQIGRNEDYNRIAILASSLKSEELLTLSADDVLHRLFWEEALLRFEPMTGEQGPSFACRCSRERVSNMLKSLGREEADAALAERGQVEVGCDFCGQQYRFDAVDVEQLFSVNWSDQQASPDAWQ